MKRHVWSIVILLGLSFWTVKPLFQSGYFTMHDDTQVSRVIVMGNALRNGQFPVRWVSDLGYGYGLPLYNFYGPLPYYLGGGLYAAGVDAVTATKVMMGIGMILAALLMYALVVHIFGRLSGILSGILYAYAPYHAVQLYVRGAVGELWAYALLPLLLYGLYLGRGPGRRNDGAWIGGLAMAGIILSHTIMGYVTVAFYGIGLMIYAISLMFKKQFHVLHLTSYILSLVIGLSLSAFFWLPALIEMGYTNVSGQIGGSADFRDHFVCISQLWNSLWGFGGSAAGCIDGMSFKIGKIHVMLGLLGFGLSVIRLRRSFWKHPIGTISIVGMLMLIMLTSFSRWIWEVLPGLAYVQYPWRLLSGVALACAFLGSSVLYWISWRWVRLLLFFMFLAAVFMTNTKLFFPQFIYDKPARQFENKEDLGFRVSKLSDEYMPPSFTVPSAVTDIAHKIVTSDKNGGLAVDQEIDTETYAKLHIESSIPREIIINRAYFPGWQYWVNGVAQPLRISGGTPKVVLPAGRSVVELRFGSTMVRHLGNIISILAVLFFIRIYGKKSVA